ncbi:MAG: tRNA (N(6)-L-threonylcarbamoyladenosine(37)-C(2))-methylthiotransferase MtaB [Bacilli bacterium]|jgi:threonylcarbamoyladenosine tRNA methylthiotransferase MtaB|nr:tRNA (N(6)-L-threonylcarbamoyladenosine(37)-C(2))-methylthiotransferase MtaB [Bacilli bacterium]
MRVALYTLGCKVNMYETIFLINQFKEKGYKIVNFKETADIYVINTCTVTNNSALKSKKTIRRVIRNNKNAIIVVIGCLVESHFTELSTDGNIHILVGNNNKTKVLTYIEEYKKNNELIRDKESLLSQPFSPMMITFCHDKTRAAVKIQDGCQNYCSYCIIPYVRGHVRSKPKDIVLSEITGLVNNGYQEIILTGINIGSYGTDLKDNSLSLLLKDILKIPNLKRLRISSLEVTDINDEILDVIAKSDIIVDHLHIPLQSGCDKILKLMNRQYNTEYFKHKIMALRKIRPKMAITTDVMVGFPGETDRDFNDTYNFINQIKFMKLHVFPYSKRAKTKAAQLPQQLSNDIKKIRVRKLTLLSKQLELEYMMQFLNQQVEILIETVDDNIARGRAGNYLLVKIKNFKGYSGTLQLVKIISISYPYLIGEISN